MAFELSHVVARLATRTHVSEDDIQGDVRDILLYGGLDLGADDIDVVLEAPAGGGKRIDIEAGYAVIEIKKDIARLDKKTTAAGQLAGYLQRRTSQTGQRYVGILTDGVNWHLHLLRPDGTTEEVAELTLTPDTNPAELTRWLEDVLATTHQIKPDPREVERRLGYRSPGFALDLADLRALYAECGDNPAVKLKRELWARLLGGAFGENFTDDDELFIRHTYLVAVAELIAHAAVGYNITAGGHTGHTLLSGELFRESDITGVVEADFFDWPVEVPGGDRWVKALARRIAVFDWSEVEHDVLKALYESVIDQETRKSLGEYYTPDWLAEHIVSETVTDPLNQRVMDPACGSGTFLFWAVRHYIQAAEAAGYDTRQIIGGATSQIFGIDLHPVAVTLARVTYLLALGLERLRQPQERKHVAIPVYLGDSIQWEEDHSLFTSEGLLIRTSLDGGQIFAQTMLFPERVIADVTRFDQLVTELSKKATTGRKPGTVPAIEAILSKHNVHPDDRTVLTETFATLCGLVDDGRNHIWGYYTRNRARPLWLARPGNRVDVLVGNPPWLPYRFMDSSQQKRFKDLSQERHLWAGGASATHQDLSALFVARSVELYLKPGGHFRFVMPAAALTRQQFKGFRAGDYHTKHSALKVTFGKPWDLTDITPTIFPVPASVIYGTRSEESVPLRPETLVWAGNLKHHRHRWEQVADKITITDTTVTVAADKPQSPYEAIFDQGATFVPRVLLTAIEAPPGPLGVPAGKRQLVSARSAYENPPWKTLRGLSYPVAERYARPMYAGSSIAHYRALTPVYAIVPWVDGELVDGDHPKIDVDTGLSSWWREAETQWEKHKATSTKLTLLEQVDYRRKLSRQFPIAHHRVVYTASGTNLAAARLTDTFAVVDKSLYWAPVGSEDEARYLLCILNSQFLLEATKPHQSKGQYGTRHFDKYVFATPFPLYRGDDPQHEALAQLGARAEEVAAGVDIPEGVGFKKARSLVVAALAEDGVAAEIETAVRMLIEPHLVKH